jgi:hypothetical protein
MSFSGRTPESLLPRSDSKNPATTCKGITTSGRPCRRPLAQPSFPGRGNGVLAVLDDQNAAVFYCWQHKDQAESLAASNSNTRLHPVRERSSLDSLVEQVGILNLDEDVSRRKKRVKRRETLPQGWNQMESPLMTVPEEIRRNPRRKKPRSNVKLSWACCIQADDDRDMPPPRTRPISATVSPPPKRPEMQSRPSPTQNLLSLIPSNRSPQTTSALLAELSRPISTADEAGYIYIFWLTPDSDTSPDDETASSLMDDEPSQTMTRALDRYASVRHRSKRTITLKIGRAANVHRRMTQWTKQCGQNISLIRYYPHNISSSSAPPSPAPKVPHVRKVERLIHLELAETRVNKSECEQCGREHREWFEIEASRKGLKGVDEVVRRWVGWAIRQSPPPTMGTSMESGEMAGYY